MIADRPLAQRPFAPSARPVSPEASIIIVTYNGLHYLASCLESVCRDAAGAAEVIVVDNGSADGSARFVREHFPHVRLVENRENRGFAAACNQGAAMAAGRVLVFLNQDTEVLPGWLDGLLSGLESDGAGLTTSKILLMSQPERLNLAGQEVHYAGLVFGRGFLEARDGFDTPCAIGAVAGASFAIRRQLWGRLGGFDESLFMYYEETDLCWRARLAGYRCLYIPGSVAYHDYRPSQPGYRSLYYSKRNRYVLLLKHWRWRTLLLLSPGLLLAEALDWGQALLSGGVAIRAKLRAIGWVASHLGAIVAGRRIVQAERRFSDLALLESCVSSVKPLEVSAGALGRGIIRLCNALFGLNYLVARSVALAETRVKGRRLG